MFIRKKKNRSGTTSIVVVDKRKGIYREIITIGTCNNNSEISSLFQQGKKWKSHHIGEQDVFEVHHRAIEEKQVTELAACSCSLYFAIKKSSLKYPNKPFQNGNCEVTKYISEITSKSQLPEANSQ